MADYANELIVDQQVSVSTLLPNNEIKNRAKHHHNNHYSFYDRFWALNKLVI